MSNWKKPHKCKIICFIQAVQFGGNVAPPGPHDNEPISLIFDPNRHIVNYHEVVQPFGSITRIESVLGTYLAQIQAHNRRIVTSVVQPQLTANQVQAFIQAHLQGSPAVIHYYLIFPDGENVHGAWTTQYGPRLVWCRSITNKFVWDLREACAKANHLNIAYCEQCAQQNETQGNIGLANMYTQQQLERIDLHITYMEQLRARILQ